MSGAGFQFSLGGVSKRSATKPKLAFGLGAAKPKLPIAFAQDSDSDGEETAGKKQRTDAGSAAAAPLPPPADPEVQKASDKLAEFVAKNGRSFENITKERNAGESPFKFLFDPSCADYRYYDAKVREFTAAQQGEQPAAPSSSSMALQSAPAPPAPPSTSAAAPHWQPPLPQPSYQQPPAQQYQQQYQQQTPYPQGHAQPQQQYQQPQQYQQQQQPYQPYAQQPHVKQAAPQQQHYSAAPPPPPDMLPAQLQPWQQLAPQPPPQQQQHSAPQAAPAAGPPAAAPPASAAAAEPAGGAALAAAAARKQSEDSLAAMEKFTRMAADRDRQRVAKERKVELLNETSFDRRRQLSVTKADGSRGHHMQDYIPPEKLAKLLSSGGDKHSQAAAAALEDRNRISSDNVGHKLLSKMGWKEGQGLGASGAGIAAPVAASGVAASAGTKLGLGQQEHGAAEEGDDEFTLYRKRMQLGYKHRPNPLGNPRKSYY